MPAAATNTWQRFLTQCRSLETNLVTIAWVRPRNVSKDPALIGTLPVTGTMNRYIRNIAIISPPCQQPRFQIPRIAALYFLRGNCRLQYLLTQVRRNRSRDAATLSLIHQYVVQPQSCILGASDCRGRSLVTGSAGRDMDSSKSSFAR